MMLAVGIMSNWETGAAFGIAFFLGREHAQAQNKLQLGDFRAFDFRLWSLDARFDFLLPALACLLCLAVARNVGY